MHGIDRGDVQKAAQRSLDDADLMGWQRPKTQAVIVLQIVAAEMPGPHVLSRAVDLRLVT